MMKKLLVLIISVFVLGLLFAGCSEIMKVFAPTTQTESMECLLRNAVNEETCLDLSNFSAGDIIEGMDTVFPGLNIFAQLEAQVNGDGDKQVVVIEQEKSPRAYGSGPLGAQSILNGCLGLDKGIGIPRNESPLDNDLYSFVFQFDEGVFVNYFSLNTLDCGDYDPEMLLEHSIALVAYDEFGQVVSSDVHTYNTDEVNPDLHNPLNPDFDLGPDYDNDPGDACRSSEEDPGNYTFEVSGHGINKVVLEIESGNGVDPFFGIRNICFNSEVIVPVDIKPTSCPNPLNTKSNGVIPVAILGTEEFDVNDIDPVSVHLEGIVPLRWAYEDVATPFDPYIGKVDCDEDCNTYGPDGYTDLTLKFEAQELIGLFNANTLDITDAEVTIYNLEDGACLVLELTGELFDGTSIYGEDVVRILKKGK